MSNLILAPSRNGKGVFANKYFKKGELIIRIKGPILNEDDIEFDSYEDEHSIQIGEETYLGPSGKKDDFINHSCNPNSGVKLTKKDFFLIAIKDIKKGEEITWDYSTWANEPWEMDCNCGTKNCRKKIKSFNYLPKKLQQKYIKLGIVPKYILKHI